MTMGRPKGSVNKRTQAYLRTNGGDLPLDYMLRLMRDPTIAVERRDDMAKAAAPYLHSKLTAIQHSGEVEVSQVVRVPQNETSSTTWEQKYVPEHLKPVRTEH